MAHKRVNITLPGELHDEFSALCRAQELPFSGIVAAFMRAYIANQQIAQRINRDVLSRQERISQRERDAAGKLLKE